MAYLGLVKFAVSPYDVDADTYSGGKIAAKMVSMTINPTYKEGSLAADDDSQAEYKKEFSYADVQIETDTLPEEIVAMMFGHKIGTSSDGGEEGEMTYAGGDIAAYVGAGSIVRQVVHGKESWVATWLKKVQFTEQEENYTTAGDNIQLTGNKIQGRATLAKDGTWRTRKRFDTKDEAVAYIAKKGNIKLD